MLLQSSRNLLVSDITKKIYLKKYINLNMFVFLIRFLNESIYYQLFYHHLSEIYFVNWDSPIGFIFT